MARPAQSTSIRLGPGQAEYVLNRLLAARRIGPPEIREALLEMDHEIKALEQRLASLRHAAGGAPIGNSLEKRGPGRPPASAAVKAASSGGAIVRRRKRAPVSAAVHASQVIQGHYLGLIGQIPEAKRLKYKKIAAEKGREAAIREMRSALKH